MWNKKTVEEFIELIDTACDIMFNCDGQAYTILCWWEDGPLIAEQITEANKAVFKDGRDMVDHYMIHGKTIRERMDEIEITYF